jgi:20S proteasome alpha/beta subunit
MTLIAGFVCSDGSVVAADTEVSGDIRTQERKLMGAGQSGHYHLVIGASGDGVACDELMQAIHDETITLPNPEIAAVEEIVRDRVRQMHEAVLFPQWEAVKHRQYFQTVEVIVGLRDVKDQHAVWRSNENIVARVTNTAFIGSGSLVASYIGERLFSEGLSTAITHHLATQVLREAKTRGTGVGGNTDVWSAKSNHGSMPYFDIPDKNRYYLWDMEDALASAVRLALKGVDEKVAKRTEFITKQLQGLSSWSKKPLQSQDDSWHTVEIVRGDLHPFRDL